MSTTSYKIFIDQIFVIAKTMTVVHHQAAIIMNHILISKGYSVDWGNKSTWRYYLNLAGEYHAADLDELYKINGGISDYLTIKIASNLGPVSADFTKPLINSLAGDVTLANEYRYGTTFYKDLVSRYPDHEALILGILNPVDINEAINAPDNTILYCGNYYRTVKTDSLGTRYYYKKRDDVGLIDPQLIEDHEVSIVEKLQKFITGFFVRWYNQDYNLMDDMYLASFLGILYSNIPNQLFNIRLNNCHTNEAHSFHIRSFLESHGKLGKYISALPLKQLLFLYRNVRWIEKNAGRDETFNFMVDNLATPSNVPLTGYVLKQNLASMPEELYPEPILQRDVINFIQTGSPFTTVSIERMLKKEINIAKDNSRDIEGVAQEMTYKLQRTWDNEVPTKIIESDMIDNSSRVPFKLEDVLFHHWVYTASQGTYTANIFVTNPRDASRTLLTPLNALILAIYVINMGYTGTAPLMVPTLVGRNIVKQSPFDLTELKKKVESSRISESKILELIGLNPAPTSFTSSEAFYDGCVAIHNELLRRYKVLAKEEYFNARGQLEHVMSSLYHIELPCDLTPSPISYQDWLNTNGYSFDNFTQEDFIAYGTALIKEATNNKENTTRNLASLQQAVIEIMKQFSSYAVQYIYQISPDNIILLNNKNLRPDNLSSSMRVFARLPLNTLNVSNITFTPNPVMVNIQSTPVVL